MKILARYVHGSEDSLDTDVIYIVDELPPLKECAEFCNSNAAENLNLATVRDGVIVQCYKGFPDEVNNAVLTTYPLHEQDDELLISRRLPRDLLLKQLSVLRKILMEMRHTACAVEARKALKSGFSQRLRFAESVDLRTVTWEISETLQKECRKRIAFQLGQAIALSKGQEVYTKRTVAACVPKLEPYLYRTECSIDALETTWEQFVQELQGLTIKDLGDLKILCDCGKDQRRISLKGREHDE